MKTIQIGSALNIARAKLLLRRCSIFVLLFCSGLLLSGAQKIPTQEVDNAKDSMRIAADLNDLPFDLEEGIREISCDNPVWLIRINSTQLLQK